MTVFYVDKLNSMRKIPANCQILKTYKLLPKNNIYSHCMRKYLKGSTGKGFSEYELYHINVLAEHVRKNIVNVIIPLGGRIYIIILSGEILSMGGPSGNQSPNPGWVHATRYQTLRFPFKCTFYT